MHDWHDIVERHGPLVWQTAYRLLQNRDDAADCHQEVFVDAIRRTAEKTIEDWAAFLRWLTVRRAIDRLRSRRRHRSAMDFEQAVDELSVPATSADVVEWNELLSIVRSEMTELPDIQAQVFWLHCIEGVSLSDIANQLNVSANHARVLLHRSRRRLRDALERRYPSLSGRQKS